MGQRLVRAKGKIRATNIPYEVPEGRDLAERLASVLDVIHLIFNEGFSATQGVNATRADLCVEALRLGHVLYQLMPHPEVGGLLALMLLHDARREARTARGGSYVPIDSQDRGKWNAQQMAQGKELLLSCLGRGPVHRSIENGAQRGCHTQSLRRAGQRRVPASGAGFARIGG
jgi:RNA polymerase sigma-70 factor, ECF subfamily